MVKKRSIATISIVIMLIAFVLTILPFLWIFITSLKKFKDIMSGSFLFDPTFKNYRSLFFERGSDFPRYTLNSVIICISATFLCLIVSSLASYSVSRFKFPGHLDKIVLLWTLILHMIHPMAIVLPVFIQMKTLGLYDTHLGLILIYATIWMPLAIWMLKGFIEDIPKSLQDSAFIDGCSTFQVFRCIIVPLIAPGLAATTIFVFIFIWNEFIFALILTSSVKVMTLPPGIARLSQQYFIKYGEMTSAAFFSTIPALILVLFVQKHIVRGLTFGAVKG